MHKSYTERNAAQKRQNELVDECWHEGVPFIAWDGDHKMEQVDYDAVTAHPLSVVAAPELNPRKGTVPLMYPNPYPMIAPRYKTPFLGEHDMVYIGNNYERYGQFLEYLAIPSKLGLRTRVFGNWIEPHVNRTPPEKVREDAPDIDFRGRIPERVVLEHYMESDFTVHLSKPSYCTNGFVTMRWAEAASGGCYAFVPIQFMGKPQSWLPAMVENGQDLYDKVTSLTEPEWYAGIDAMQQWVEEHMKVEPWIELFEEMAGRA